MHHFPKVIRPVLLNTCRMSTQNSSTPVIKNFNDWKVERDPPPDIHIVFFSNQKQEYYSYNPPVGFTAEEIMQFPGAKESLGTVEKVKELLELKGKLGTLDTTDHWKPSDVKQ
ncbi:hypothetical protein BT96DRAFT_1018548 [Gymnopus androsaceus JB14]|uniref:Uncharacterized protein n=1 Tax=Gymnopus androsaceus JB14 TaxID=1447944 RepID=A0A6A4HWE0_9AGAR|nr:hypothetical protein BT96DRAFT_1018548 [Gymnopus androsaceus JB14]